MASRKQIPRRFVIGALITYELTDGSFDTVEGIMKRTGLSKSRAYIRLRESRDPKDVYKEPAAVLNKKRFYTLTDGSTITVDELTERLNCDRRTAAARLYRTLDPERIFAPVRNPEIEKPVDTSDRMYYDNDGFWNLFNKI